MTLLNRILSIACLVAAATTVAPAAYADRAERAERRHIAEGNKQYNNKRYAEAEAEYNKALQQNSKSEKAIFNLASALLRQASPGESGKELMEKAQQMFQSLLSPESDKSIGQRAAYDLGNMAYNTENYDQAINFYKEALRRDPSDDKARQNLRMAQLKKKEQDQNKDQNKDQNQDQQDQNKDQQDQNKDQQDQNKDQNKDQQNQNQNQNQDQNKDQQQKQQPKGGISDENAEKILKAMENEEMATRRRVQEAEKKEKDANAGKRVVTKPW